MQQLIFSIIIPTYNRPVQLTSCLESINKLKYSRELFEVIVVDDGSSLALDSVTGLFLSTLNIKLIKQANAGPAAARNTGAKNAQGQYLVFTDDDCCPDENWLIALNQQLQKTPDCIVGGQTLNSLTGNLYAATSQLIVDMGYKYCNANTNAAQFFASNNMAFPADLFHKISGFKNEFRTSEDRELCHRWLSQGYTMRYCADAIIYHAHHLNLISFCQQHFNYGRGPCRFHTFCQLQGSGEINQALGFHAHLHQQLARRLREMKLATRTIIIVLLLVWQFVNALGFFFQAGLQRIKA